MSEPAAIAAAAEPGAGTERPGGRGRAGDGRRHARARRCRALPRQPLVGQDGLRDGGRGGAPRCRGGAGGRARARSPTPAGVRRVDVESALEMREAVLAELPARHDRGEGGGGGRLPARRAPPERKIKKEDLPEGAGLTLELVRTPDILAEICRDKGDRVVVGFAAESHDVIEAARRKLARKGCDLLVANDISRAGVGLRRGPERRGLRLAGRRDRGAAARCPRRRWPPSCSTASRSCAGRRRETAARARTACAWLLVWLGSGAAAGRPRQRHRRRRRRSIRPPSDFIQKAIDQSEEDGAVALLIDARHARGRAGSRPRTSSRRCSTPSVPSIVYVSPQGAWAASAGTFITMAATRRRDGAGHQHRGGLAGGRRWRRGARRGGRRAPT